MNTRWMALVVLAAGMAACAGGPPGPGQTGKWNTGLWNSVLGYHGPANETAIHPR